MLARRRRRAGARRAAGGAARCRPRRAGAARARVGARGGAARRAGRGARASKDRAGVAACGRAALGRPLRGLLEALPDAVGGRRAVARTRARAAPAGRAAKAAGAARRGARRDARRRPRRRSAGAGITLDLGEVRGFDYYTGMRFAGYAPAPPDAVLRGGRYDELLARYGRAARATGFAVDLEALAQAQRAAGVPLPPRADGVLVAAVRDRRRAADLVAAALRAAGDRAAVDLRQPARPARARRVRPAQRIFVRARAVATGRVLAARGRRDRRPGGGAAAGREHGRCRRPRAARARARARRD